MLTEHLLYLYSRYFPLDRGKWRVVEHLWQSTIGPGSRIRTATLQAGGYSMKCDLNLMLQRQFYFFGTYFLERDNLACWSDFTSKANVIFDVGANLGIYSLTAAASGPAARIHAFEPTPDLSAHFKQTLHDNQIKNVTVVQKAVARVSGMAVLNLWGDIAEGNEGMNFVTAQPRSADSIPVATVSLDDYCAEAGIEQIDLLKIDIQGNEPEALRGASHLLSKGRIRCLFLELNWAANPGDPCSATDTIEILSQHGYLFALPKAGAQPRSSGPWLRDLSDVVAVCP
jgi:FkbM family methyltransferase